MKNRLSIAALLASAALAMGVAQPAFSADTAEPVVIAQAADDAAIRSNVEAAIAGDASLQDAAITVDVKEGTVVLSGQVSNEEHSLAAATAASGVEGVVGVTNELKLPGQ